MSASATAKGKEKEKPIASLLAGATAGGVESFITYPFESLKTQLQFGSLNGEKVCPLGPLIFGHWSWGIELTIWVSHNHHTRSCDRHSPSEALPGSMRVARPSSSATPSRPECDSRHMTSSSFSSVMMRSVSLSC